jgi:hypothetical protein
LAFWISSYGHFDRAQYEKLRDAGYFDVIVKPLDFKTVEYKMKSIHYIDWDEEEKDLRLIFENARTWNKHTDGKYKEEVDAANELEALLDQLLKEPFSPATRVTKIQARDGFTFPNFWFIHFGNLAIGTLQGYSIFYRSIWYLNSPLCGLLDIWFFKIYRS